jgi:nicotinamide-nucleotide amidase
MTEPGASPTFDSASRIVSVLTARHTTLGIAESLTGGLLAAAVVEVPGASAVLRGAVVAYDTGIKHSLLGVDAEVLAAHGPVHPDVAMQMATGVRTALALNGEEPQIGLATTGVAGPEPQDGHAPGTAYIGLAVGSSVRSVEVHATGDRSAVRAEVVARALALLEEFL